MAQRVNIELIDDMDGKTAATQTVSFGLDGTTYEVDLADKNAEKIRNALAPFIAAGRRVGKAPKAAGKSKAGSNSSGPNPREVRAWAVEQGYEVPARGRIPAEVTEAYNAAH